MRCCHRQSGKAAHAEHTQKEIQSNKKKVYLSIPFAYGQRLPAGQPDSGQRVNRLKTVAVERLTGETRPRRATAKRYKKYNRKLFNE
jgi:hypothetical protein